MEMEWFWYATILALSTGPVAWHFRRRGVWVWLVYGLALTACVAAAAARSRHIASKRLVVESLHSISPREGRPGGYTGSDSCQSCHPHEYSTWHRNYHRTMTQRALPGNVIPEFDKVSLELKGEAYVLERVGDEYWAEMPDPEFQPLSRRDGVVVSKPRVRKRLTLLTGSHHMQVYWVPVSRPNAQLLFPFCYLVEDRAWVPFHNTFLRDPKLEDPLQIWNNNCINCHSTGGQPRPQQTALATADTRTAELGIGCEACHGPGESHVRFNQSPLARYAHRSGASVDGSIVNPAKLNSKASSQVCGNCHGIKWIPGTLPWKEEGFPYRPGDDLDATTPIARPARTDLQPWLEQAMRRDPRFKEDRYWPDGIVRVSGRDFNGTLESACYQKGEMSCLSCHSMHHSDPKDMLKRGMEGNEACLQCHGDYRDKITEHTHHRADSTGSLCYNCHMPHVTYGLLKGIRNHFIESPSVKTTLSTQRPLACNLCHLDKSLGWSSRHLASWYGHPIPRLDADQESIAYTALMALRGDAGQRALMAWTLGWDSAKAIGGSDWQIPLLGQLMADSYSAVRFIAARSARSIPGFGQIQFDFVGPEAARAEVVESMVRQWESSAIEKRKDAAVLMTRDGAIDFDTWRRLRGKRDEKSVDLQE